MKKGFHGIAITILAIMVLAFVDASISGLLEPDTLFRAMRGSRIPVSGILEKAVEGAQTSSGFVTERYDPNTLLLVTPADPAFRMNFKELKGKIWRGELEVAENASQGEYRFRVHGRYDSPTMEDDVYVLRIFVDQAAYQADFRSWFMRLLGIRPWIAAMSLIPVGILLLGASFIISGRDEARLQAKGIGSIYKCTRRDDHWEVVFGLGGNHGVNEGDRLMIMDRRRAHVGDLVAQKVRADFSIARVGLDVPLKPDFLVARGLAARGEHSGPAHAKT